MIFKGAQLRFTDNVVTTGGRCNLAAVLAVAGLVLAGCSGGTEFDVTGRPFPGAVVADEPRAAEVGAAILARGGSAADAAVATYFALSVTYPSAASLGGGGVCLVADPAVDGVAALSFPAPRAVPWRGALRRTAVPANVRGVGALHARFGRLDWRMLPAPAERMARFGVPVSRAAAQAYRAAGAKLLTDGESRRVFAASGRIPQESQVLTQPDLADTLGQLRTNGPGALYDGVLADELVAAVRQGGGTLSHEDLRNFAPAWAPALAVEFENDTVFFAGPPAGAGIVAGQMWRMLIDGDRYRDAAAGERAHLLVESSRRAFAGRDRWLADDGTTVDAEALLSREAGRRAMSGYDPERAVPANPARVSSLETPVEPASTGFVVVDAAGGAVACNFTAYAPFGAGSVAAGTGILVAPAPGPDQRNPLSLGPMMVVNPFLGTFKFAAVGGGGPGGPPAMITVAAESMLAGRRLEDAIRHPRAYGGGGATARIERSAPDDLVSALSERGHDLSVRPAIGRVNAIHCPPGHPAEESAVLCRAESDPRGHGLAAHPR